MLVLDFSTTGLKLGISPPTRTQSNPGLENTALSPQSTLVDVYFHEQDSTAYLLTSECFSWWRGTPSCKEEDSNNSTIREATKAASETAAITIK